MAEHSKGPWTLSKTREGGQFIVQCKTNFPGAKGTIATCGYKPNAQLVAAAPALLEACKAALDYTYNKATGKESTPPTWVRDQLRQAIKQAEGD